MSGSKPLAGPITRASAVATELRRRILSGELAPGTRLRQIEISEQLGVSTTPVREAFSALTREGLVRHDVHRGVVVFKPSIDDIREIYEIRIELEPLATGLAAGAITDATLDDLEAIAAEMQVALVEDPVHHTAVLNPKFHAMIYEAADRPRLLDLITSLREASLAYLSRVANQEMTPEYAKAVQQEHEEIVAALRKRNPRRAAKAMRGHLEVNRDQIMRSLGVEPNE